MNIRRVFMHRILHFSLSCIAAVLLCPPTPADEAQDSREQITETVARSIPFILKEGESWIQKRDCLSCHHTSFMVWSLKAAQEIGVGVPQDKLEEHTAWATEWTNIANPKRRAEAEKIATLEEDNDTVAQLLLSGVAPQTEADSWRKTLLTSLTSGQEPDGSWSAGGQLPLQKRPEAETHQVSTRWALIALLSEAEPVDADTAAAEADAWLKTETPGISAEWWATRMLLSHLQGDAQQTEAARNSLLSFRNEDGGWGWLTADDSDALATGIALYCLVRSGSDPQDDAVRDAVRFLCSTQKPDGSWAVRCTKKTKRNKVEPTSVYWGTCWATIGLCESLREPGADPAP